MTFGETGFNHALAESLSAKINRWTATAEHSSVIRDHSGLRPDIVVSSPGRRSVVIENEFGNASNAEREAHDRLGLILNKSGEKIQSAVALVTSDDLKSCSGISDAKNRIKHTTFRYSLHMPRSRFPGTGWLSGDIDDLVWFILHAGTPTDAVEEAIKKLDTHVQEAINILDEAGNANQHTLNGIAKILKQDFADKEFVSPKTKQRIKSIRQALGVVATVMLNAMVYQQRLAEMLDVRNFARMDADNDLNQAGILREWDRILEVNYWSVFALARELLYTVHHPILADRLVQILGKGAAELTAEGIASSEDLAGVVFQRFLTDRKYLAAFYTKPESAELLAHLAIPSWTDAEKYQNFRIADFASGTGTLIHAAYRRISILQEMAGGDPAKDHFRMMENNLVAADIVPSAAHLTASMLSGLYPDQKYEHTRVLIPRYGKFGDSADYEAKHWSDVRLGSLELMPSRGLLDLDWPKGAKDQKVGSQEAVESTEQIPHESQDIVIMNPPFTRAASDWDHSGKHVRQYRGLGTLPEEQKLMAKRQVRFFAGTCSHGYAGLGSTFLALADKKLKQEGVLAFVLPFSITSGFSWRKARSLLMNEYGELCVVSVAAEIDSLRSFSADTGMAEVLIVAKKGSSKKRIKFVNLKRSPRNNLEANTIARAVIASEGVKELESEPLTSGTEIRIGEEKIGLIMTAPCDASEMWSIPGVSDLIISQVLFHLERGRLVLPQLEKKIDIPMCQIRDLGQLSTNAANIANQNCSAFNKVELSDVPIYPMLWGHAAKKERRMELKPNCEAQIRKGKESIAKNIWNMRSHFHVSLGTRVTSQSLTACFTDMETIGGESWPNVRVGDKRKEAALVLWMNSTLGAMMQWYHGGRTQTGRTRYSVASYERLPILDVRELTKKQLDRLWNIFEASKVKDLQPLNCSNWDAVRHQIDDDVLIRALGVSEDIREPLAILRRKWCIEPTMGGSDIRIDEIGKAAEFEADPTASLAAESLGGFRRKGST